MKPGLDILNSILLFSKKTSIFLFLCLLLFVQLSCSFLTGRATPEATPAIVGSAEETPTPSVNEMQTQIAQMLTQMPTKAVTQNPTSFFQVTPRSVSYQGVIDQYLDNFTESASISYNIQETMKLGETYQIKLILSPSKTETLLKTELATEVATPNANIESATIKISPEMEAHLTGAAFLIVPQTPDRQLISHNDDTLWQWAVTPQKEGIQPITLTLIAHIHYEGISGDRALPTFNNSVNVRVTLGDKMTTFIYNNWQWLWSFILLPVVGWIYSLKKMKMDGKKEVSKNPVKKYKKK